MKPKYATVSIRNTMKRMIETIEKQRKSEEILREKLGKKNKTIKRQRKSLESKDKLIQSHLGDEPLFMNYVLPRNPFSAEHRLVKAAFKIANGFIAHQGARSILFKIGERAKSSIKNPRRAIFLKPDECFKMFPKDNRYAYSWIDPALHGPSTIVFDQAFLTRYQALIVEPDSNKAAKYEMNLIETFVGMKTVHEEGHLAFRETYPKLIKNDRTPPGVNGGETGDFLERNLFGGTTGFAFKGEGQWNGNPGQQIVGLHVHGVLITKKYILGLVEECNKQEPHQDTSKILPVVTCRRKYVPPWNVRIMSTVKSTDEQMDIVTLNNGVVLVPGGLCGVRFLGLKPKKLALDSVAESPASQGQEALPTHGRRSAQPAVQADAR
jgi:hypothetical protein